MLAYLNLHPLEFVSGHREPHITNTNICLIWNQIFANLCLNTYSIPTNSDLIS